MVKQGSLVTRALYWTGAVVVAKRIAPGLKRSARPLLSTVIGGAFVLADQARAWAALAREEAEDILAEARHLKTLRASREEAGPEAADSEAADPRESRREEGAAPGSGERRRAAT